jgi:hypothetical protein
MNVCACAGGAAAVRVHLPRRTRPDRARRYQPGKRTRRVFRGPGTDGPHAQHFQVISNSKPKTKRTKF